MINKIKKYLGKINSIEFLSKKLDAKIGALQKSLDRIEKIEDEQKSAREIYKVFYRYVNIDSKEKKQNCFMAAVPDSMNYFDMYPEFKEMYPLFIGKNTDNNIRDFSRLYAFILNINHVLRTTGGGAFAELGVYKGTNAAVMAKYCQKFKRELYLFDTFEGFDNRDLTGIDGKQKSQFADTSLSEVKKFVGDGEQIFYMKGYFPDSVTDKAGNEKYAFVSLDCDLYNPIRAGLEFFYPRLVKNGMIFVHDYRNGFFDGCTKAVDEFCTANDITAVLMPDKSGTAVITK